MCVPTRIRVETTTRKSSGRPIIRTVSKYDAAGRRIRDSFSSFGSYDEKPRRSKSHRHRRQDSYDSDSYPSSTSYPVVYPPVTYSIPPPPPPGGAGHSMATGTGMQNRLIDAAPVISNTYGIGASDRYEIVEASPTADSCDSFQQSPSYAMPTAPVPPTVNITYGDDRDGRSHSSYHYDRDYRRSSTRDRSSLPRGVRMGSAPSSGVRYVRGYTHDYDDGERDYAGTVRYTY